MKMPKFKTALLVASIATALAGCGTGEIDESNFGSSNPVVYKDAKLVKTISEMSGKVQINLFEGAELNGQALTNATTAFVSGLEFEGVRAFPEDPTRPYLSPVVDGNTPFKMLNENILEIDTDMFDDLLRECDYSDVLPEGDAETPDGDGVRDNPDTITYIVKYKVNVGYNNTGTQEERTLELTINAVPDTLKAINIEGQDTEAGIVISEVDASGNPGTGQLVVEAVPSYACEADLQWEIADESIATIDNDGLITAVSRNVTSVQVSSEKYSFANTATVRVVDPSEFGVIGANIGRGAETQNFMACIPGYLHTGYDLNFGFYRDADYDAAWTLEQTAGSALALEAPNTFGPGMLSRTVLADANNNTALVSMATTYVDDNGESHAYEDTMSVAVTYNKACETENTAEGVPWSFDYEMESLSPPDDNQVWVNEPSNATSVESVAGMTGNGVQMNILNQAEPTGTAMALMNWAHEGPGNIFSYILTAGKATGQKVAAQVWVKLSNVPLDSDGKPTKVTVEHYMSPWFYGPARTPLGGFPAGRSIGDRPGAEPNEIAANDVPLRFSGDVRPTIEWQLVDFVSQTDMEAVADGTLEKAGNFEVIPASWEQQSSVIIYFETKGLPNGESIIFDNYGFDLQP